MERRFDRITQDPNVLAGRAAIRGLRISVAHVVSLVANGLTPAQAVGELPDLEEEDVRQALGYAAALAGDEIHPIRLKPMRFLADAVVSGKTVDFLKHLRHEAVHIRTLGLRRATGAS